MSPKCSMALVYLPTKLGDFVAYVGKYTIHGAHGSIQKSNVLLCFIHVKSNESQVLCNTNWLVYNVGETIINHPPITNFRSNTSHSQMDGL